MNWFKMYAEFASDPKVQSMSEPMQRRLTMLFCLHCSGNLESLTDEELALALRIKPNDLEKTKEVFRRKGFIEGTWVPKNWRKRQAPSDPTARDRMRAMRARHEQEERNVTAQRYGGVTRNGSVTPVTVTRPDTDTEEERDQSVCVSRAHAREGDDLRDWEEAMEELQGDPTLKLIGDYLRDSASVPSVAGLDGWRFLHAAHVIRGRPEKATWNFFEAVARRASRREFDAWHDPPVKEHANGTGGPSDGRHETPEQAKRRRIQEWANS